MGRVTCAAVALTVVLLGLVGGHGRAEAAKPTAVVAMGDSYISGEAGRWAGNSQSATPGNDGTDRACTGTPTCSVDKSKVYVDGTDTDGCHRSDVAEVVNASLPVAKRINLACSGAVTSDLLTTAEGGTMDHGETPQGDQLGKVARDNDVKAVVVSIGGNDLGFAAIIQACLVAYTSKTGPCKPAQQAMLAAGIPAAQAKVAGVVDSIRGVMRGAGYTDSSYRLILQGYPSVAPRAAENRYPEMSPQRSADGCGNYDIDSDWARDEASAEIDKMVSDAAASRGTEYLDLHDLFQGHEVCSKDAGEATPLSKPDAAHSEWGRPVGASFIQQGETQEAFHPNAIGQQAFGACLGAAYAAGAPGRFTCANAANRAPADVLFARTATLETSPTTSPTPTPSATPSPTPTPGAGGPKAARKPLHLTARVRRGCVRFTATSRGKRVRGVRIAYRGRHRRTGRAGRVSFCGRVPKHLRRFRATAHKTGYKAARVRVRVKPAR